MHSVQHSRARILFEVACIWGLSASCVWAWMQTYATAFVPAAAITALYGLVHAFDMVRSRPAADEPIVAIEAVSEPAPVFAEAPAEAVVATDAKPKRKPARKKVAAEVAEPVQEVVDVIETTEPEVAELQPTMRVVDSVPDEPEYYPATPLFEPEPFLRQQRAAFGRKAR